MSSKVEFEIEESKPSPKDQRLSLWRQYVGGVHGWVAGGVNGMNAAYVSVGIDSFQKEYQNGSAPFALTISQIGLFGSLGVLGSSIGSIVSGYLTRKYGRKKPSLASLVPYILGYGLIIFSRNFYTMLAGQFIVGLTQGVRAPISRMFLSEISHPKHRGFYVTLYIFATMTFQLMVYIAALWLDWIYLAVFCAFVPVAFVPLMLYIPESHVWLIANGREEEAKTSLQWFYGKGYNIDCEYEEELNYRRETEQAMTSWREFFRLQYLKPVIYIAGFVVLRQFSGGTTIMQFMSHIFRRSHTGIDAKYCVIILGFFQLIFVAISGIAMDRIGRRKCMYISGTIMGVSQVAVGVFEYLHTEADYRYLTESVTWMPLLLLCLTMMGFTLGMASMVFVLIGELVPLQIKNEVNGWKHTLNKLTEFGVFIAFHPMLDNLGFHGTFWFYGAICLFSVFYIKIGLHETQGQSLANIEKMVTSTSLSSKA